MENAMDIKSKILLIDDEPELTELLSSFLSYEGYDVTVAGNGKKGMALLNEGYIPDLIITDIVMDEMDGIEFIQKVRSKFPKNKVIAMSGGGRINAESYLEIAKQFGVLKVVTKPIKMDELLSIIQEHI